MQRRTKSDRLIVVDIETTCSNQKAEQIQNEIIEIGASIVDMKTLSVETNLSLFVKPQRSQVTPFCTKLTGITPEDVAEGLTLEEACNVLIGEYQSDEYAWASWGDFDRLMINRECKFYKARFPFNRQHLNLKVLFALHHRLPELVGLEQAAKYVGQEFIGKHHRGVDDARTAAQLLLLMGGIAGGKMSISLPSDFEKSGGSYQ